MKKLFLLAILLAAPLAFTQNECSGTGDSPISILNTTDSLGVVHQNACYGSTGRITFYGGLGKGGGGFKHQRFGSTNTTTATAGASANTSYNWTTPFADANYTVVCVGGQPTGTPTGMLANGQTASGVLFQITAITAAVSSYAFVDCIAVHD